MLNLIRNNLLYLHHLIKHKFERAFISGSSGSNPGLKVGVSKAPEGREDETLFMREAHFGITRDSELLLCVPFHGTHTDYTVRRLRTSISMSMAMMYLGLMPPSFFERPPFKRRSLKRSLSA